VQNPGQSCMQFNTPSTSGVRTMKLRLTTVLENGELLERDGLLCEPNSTEPLAAKVEQFDENGQLTIMYTAIGGALSL
jgi:hypothetical protein